MNNITSVKEKENKDTITNAKIIKLATICTETWAKVKKKKLALK